MKSLSDAPEERLQIVLWGWWCMRLSDTYSTTPGGWLLTCWNYSDIKWVIVCSSFTQKADSPTTSFKVQRVNSSSLLSAGQFPLIEISCLPRLEISGMFPNVFWKHASSPRQQRRQPQVFHPPQADQCPGSWVPRIRCAHSMVFVASIISTPPPNSVAPGAHPSRSTWRPGREPGMESGLKTHC